MSVIPVIVYKKIIKNKCDNFTAILMYSTCSLLLLLFTIAGPVFIDRSISYHIVFYATEEKSIDIEEMEKEFSKEIFSKRIDDALKSGMIEEERNGRYRPTLKAKIASTFLIPLGKATNTLETYENMKRKIDEDREND